MQADIEQSQECSLRIETIWSEAEHNGGVKEEVVSDVEPETCPPVTENSVDGNYSNSIADNKGHVNGFSEMVQPMWKATKKKVKVKSLRVEESEFLADKLSCVHDPKHFKIIKRTLRCGDCRSMICPECCKIVTPNLRTHFSGLANINPATYFCEVCSIAFHSVCALQAHIRIHTMGTPYVCPDCGFIYNNIYFLILHLLNKCCHLYKVIRYKCKLCKGYKYFSSKGFLNHVKEKHLHSVNRCFYCSSLFSDYNEFHRHVEEFHQFQKVQYLNYFRCSLCSDMVIPRFMYENHIATHRENSEDYKINYECLCGETFNVLDAFRAHFCNCSQKGVPVNWSFLMTKFKNPNMLSTENYSQFFPKPLFIYTRKNEEKPEEICIEEEVIVNNETGLARAENLESSEKNCTKGGEEEIKDYNVVDQEQSGPYEPNLLRTDKVLVNLSEKERSALCAKIIAGVEKENPDRVTDENMEKIDNGETTQGNEEVSKIYDHIPCDHLGYLSKSQGSESSSKAEEKCGTIEQIPSPSHYKLVTELDEKTGVMTTKKVIDEVGADYSDEEEDENSDENELELEVQGENDLRVGDKHKGKSDGCFRCPFCVVLFPKDNMKLQKFLLHLESYHSDAALNVSVTEEQESTKDKLQNDKVSDTKTEINGTDLRSYEENNSIVYSSQARILKDGLENHANGAEKELPKSQTTTEPVQSLATAEPDSGIESKSHNNSLNEIEKERGPNNEVENNDTVVNNEEKTCNGKKSEHFQNLRDSKTSSNSESNVDRNISNKTSVSVAEGETLNVIESKNQKSANEFLSKSSCVTDSAGESKESEVVARESGINKNDAAQVIKSKGRFGEVVKNVEGKEKENEKLNKECNLVESLMKNEETEKIEEIRSEFWKDSSKMSPDFEYEGETSKDSNWSTGSGKECLKNDASYESKNEDREKSRRESEVWSELYESLMLAEKLKKKKNPSPESESKTISVVSDYSSKRKVKKPKRYRESSDSGDSLSASDDELLRENLVSKDGEQKFDKKQVLLTKLEKIDGKLVDYLFELVTRKEKLFELYDKHSSLRANRYSQNLRSYRKKVLNGIKRRGRPYKILRYHEVLKKKEDLPLPEENESVKKEMVPGVRKRGRPRKYHDPGKLKERRRSDKEVDFIERNFERDESDLSPCKRKRKLSSKLQYYKKLSDEKEDFSSGQVINKCGDSHQKLTCAVCQESFQELDQFKEHIVTHKVDENSYQCMECGECFVVRPSLEKHLHAFHKIKNTDKYITDNECVNVKKELEPEPLKENQCKVCKDQFDRAIDLTKHFRIHGMAFLKEFRRDGKPPEKTHP